MGRHGGYSEARLVRQQPLSVGGAQTGGSTAESLYEVDERIEHMLACHGRKFPQYERSGREVREDHGLLPGHRSALTALQQPISAIREFASL